MSPSTEQRENRTLALELKFIVPHDAGEAIRAWARGKLAPDPNAPGNENDQYQITSLYFDTPRWDVFHRNCSYGRSKYRIRRYGESETMFLERKLKTRGFVSKRRTLVSEVELGALTGNEVLAGWKGKWFHERLLLRRLQPICQISYQRTARVTMTPNGPLRLTIDDGLKGMQVAVPQFLAQGEYHPLLAGQAIIELKFRGEMPVIFKELLEKFNLSPVGLSKYRTAVKAFGIATPAQKEDEMRVAYA
ncbi:MAG: polyphosphate polymerase domain-containing protein [Verrucomicrobiales bacterium]